MSKAYDRVNHEILLSKLNGTGIRGVAYKWFASYLERRHQYAEVELADYRTGKIEQIRSDLIPVTGSIPQGSVLGCILFIIYINDLTAVLNKQCILLADDISILLTCSEVGELKIKLDETLDMITEWLDDHNLTLNFSKTSLIQFGSGGFTNLPPVGHSIFAAPTDF